MGSDAVSACRSDNLLLVAAFLAARAEFVVVGGCALRMHGVDHCPADLDVVPEPSLCNVRRLFDGLSALGTVGREWRPTDYALMTRDIVSRTTPVGVVDVLLSRGREGHARFVRQATSVSVKGQGVSVAAVEDVVSLRVRFGKVPGCG